MKGRKLKPTKFPPNLQTYIDTFGHLPSREAQKFKSMEELDNLAEYALRRGKPIRSWENRNNVKTGTLLDAYYPSSERSENKPKSKDRDSEPQRNPLGQAQSYSIPNTSLFDSLFWRVKRDFEEFSISKSDELEGVWWWPIICLCSGAGVGYVWYWDSSSLGGGIGGFFMVYGGFISGSSSDPLQAFIEHFAATGLILLMFWVFDFSLLIALISCLIMILVSGIVTLRVMADSIRQSRYKL
jgi:hypothetical protein